MDYERIIMDTNKLCRGCFTELLNTEKRCPYCGFDMEEYERDRRPDVYALCAAMYKMMTGKTPDDLFIRADDNRSSEKLMSGTRKTLKTNFY